jgi:TetR/AcrR family transcriptional repressor of lmrAB and yxaGH operons
MPKSTAVTALAPSPDPSTRRRLIDAALLLFRRHGYHGVGVSEILTQSGLSKGSLYHFFPEGKQELGIAVVQDLTERVLAIFEESRSPTTELLLRRVGGRISRWMQRTGDGTLAMLASFVVESYGLPGLRHAVRTAYEQLEQWLRGRLQADGFDKATALERAQLAIALFEGGGMLSQAHGQPQVFARAIECAARLCARPGADA